jgi:DNA polymerase III delta prime subunit
MRYNDTEFQWAQKYRPRKVEDCILPKKTKDAALRIVSSGVMQNLLLANSNPGCGKSTLAMAICEELGLDYIVINASLDANIDSLRNEVKSHASTLSFTGAKKAIIWEEADAIPASTQNALRAFMEEYSSNCSHILTANYAHKLLEPILSRCFEVEFGIVGDEKLSIQIQMLKSACRVLDKENIEYDKAVVAELIARKFPDFRNVLNTLQGYADSANGKIDSGILISITKENFKELVGLLKEKNFTGMRKWLIDNQSIDSTVLFNTLYETANFMLKSSSVPELVLILSKYQANVSIVANQEINTAACLTEVMMLDGWL